MQGVARIYPVSDWKENFQTVITETTESSKCFLVENTSSLEDKEPECKAHFGIVDIASLPLDVCSTTTTFIEEYYDTPDFSLLQQNLWLRQKPGDNDSWVLKQVLGTESYINHDCYVLTYNTITTESSIERFLLSEKQINFADLKCYAQFIVTRYCWEGDITIDVCEFGLNDFFAVGTMYPTIPGNFTFLGRCDVNSKIIEYLLFQKKLDPSLIPTKPTIQRIQPHYKCDPIQEPRKKNESYIRQKQKEQKLYDELLKLIPKEIQNKYLDHFALVYNESGKKKLGIFKSYRDLISSSLYKKHGGDFIIIPDPAHDSESKLLLDDLLF